MKPSSLSNSLANIVKVELQQEIDQTNQALSALREDLDEAYEEWSTCQTELENMVESAIPLDNDFLQKETKIFEKQEQRMQVLRQQTEFCLQASQKLSILQEGLDLMAHEQRHKQLGHKRDNARIELHALQIEYETKSVKYAARVRSIEKMELTPDFGIEAKAKRLRRANNRMEHHHHRCRQMILRSGDYVMDSQIKVQHSARKLKDRKKAWEENNVIDM